MRDMLDGDEPYPLTAWSAQFDRIRTDLDDALQPRRARSRWRSGRRAAAVSGQLARAVLGRRRSHLRPGARRDGRARRARRSGCRSRRGRPRSSTAVARLLVQNNEAEEQTAHAVQDIYDRVQRQVYWFLAATLAAIVATSLYLIRSNRRLFAQLASLSDERRELAQKLIATRESTLREISRELHDEFGQILTAIGSMLAAPASTRRRARRCARICARSARSRRRRSTTSAACRRRCTRRSSRSSAREHASTGICRPSRSRLGVAVSLRASRRARVPVDATIGDSRLPRAAGSAEQRGAPFRRRRRRGSGCASTPDALELEVEDHGNGLRRPGTPRRGLGLVAMRERAELVGRHASSSCAPPEGGTLVRSRSGDSARRRRSHLHSDIERMT